MPVGLSQTYRHFYKVWTRFPEVSKNQKSMDKVLIALSGHRSSYWTCGLFFRRSSDGISRIWGSFYKSREFDLRSSDGILFFWGGPRWSSSTTSTSPIKKFRFDEKAIRAFSNRPISKSGSSDGVVKLKVLRF